MLNQKLIRRLVITATLALVLKNFAGRRSFTLGWTEASYTPYIMDRYERGLDLLIYLSERISLEYFFDIHQRHISIYILI